MERKKYSFEYLSIVTNINKTLIAIAQQTNKKQQEKLLNKHKENETILFRLEAHFASGQRKLRALIELMSLFASKTDVNSYSCNNII